MIDYPPILPAGVLYAPTALSESDAEAIQRAWRAHVTRPQMVILPPPDLDLIDGYRAPGVPSMDFYHLMNAGLLFSLVGLIAAILYAALSSA